MRHVFTLILAPFLIFCTAVPPESVPPDYLVTAITVTTPDSSLSPQQIANEETMVQILHYLRFVPLAGQADEDSLLTSLPLYTIQLTHANGRITEYRQLGTEYLSKNDGAWYHIEPDRGRTLEELLGNSETGFSVFLLPFSLSPYIITEECMNKEAVYGSVTKYRHFRPC